MQVLPDPNGQVPDGVATVATTGAYDGIHRGHQLILDRVRSEADARGLAASLVTFDVHPAKVLRPENAPLMLTSNEQRMRLFEAAKIDFTYLMHFDMERSKTSVEEFVANVLVGRLNAQLVVVGEDFHFGRARSGNVDRLIELGAQHDFEVIGMPLLQEDGAIEPISSTAIRRSLAGGDVAAAARMLGRPFEIEGEVVRGDQRGRTIGFPTANILVTPDRAWPADGVYAGRCTTPEGTVHTCAINIGRRPTFEQHAENSLLEAHLIDFDGDLYGKWLRVEFIEFLRSEQRFDGIDALSAQLKKDVAATREALR